MDDPGSKNLDDWAIFALLIGAATFALSLAFGAWGWAIDKVTARWRKWRETTDGD